MDLATILQLLSAVITILVLIYLFVGNNPLFRAVSYSFVGVAAGYVLVLVIFQVLMPRMVTPLLRGDFLAAVVPLVLGILLLFKLSPRLSFIGSVSMAMIVGVGAAVAIGGAVFGTIFGQVNGTFATLSPKQPNFSLGSILEGFFVLLGTVCTLAYFQFGVADRRNLPAVKSKPVEWLGRIGQVFIGITLGAVFAGVFAAAISALVERIGFIINTIALLIHS